MTTVRWLAALGVLGLALSAAGADAHTGGTTGYASLIVQHSTVRYRVTLTVESLPAQIAEDVRLTRQGSPRAAERLLDVVRQRIGLRGDGVRCEPGPGVVEPAAIDAPNVSLQVDFACSAGLRRLDIRDDLFDVLGSGHHTLMKVEWSDGTRQFALEPSLRETSLTVGAPATRGVASFVALGVEHILTGWDHLLFLFGLMLRGGGWLGLTQIITAFTLAHSVTLALAVLDVVVLPDRLVEAVIALSIACVAAENLVERPLVSRRWLVSFCFGLVHGFGFSSALRELGLPAHGLMLSLFGFNGGVEIGQAMVVAIALPALALLRNTRWEPRMVWSSSLAILLVGVVLFVERAFFQ